MNTKHGPVITKGTRASERANDHARPVDKGDSKPVGGAITDKKGIHPPVTKFKFMRNKSEYC